MHTHFKKEAAGAFGERLRRARAMRGLSLRGLSEALGERVSHAALGKYEKGQMMPSSGVLIALSRALSLRPDYFFEQEPVTLEELSFRKRARLGKKGQARVVEEAGEFVERYLEVERVLGIESPPLPRIEIAGSNPEEMGEQAEAAAEAVREAWQLGHDPLANVHELLEDHGVKVVDVVAEDDFDGMSGRAGETPIIVLAKWLDADPARKRLTGLHELGHLVMAMPPGTDPKTAESLSYRFAGAMLFPAERFREEFGTRGHGGLVSMAELAAMKGQWGMSMAAIMRRARDLGLISAEHHTRFCKQINTLGWKKREPGEWSGTERGCRFRQLVHRAAAQGLITRSKAAGLLGVSPGEFDRQFDRAV